MQARNTVISKGGSWIIYARYCQSAYSNNGVQGLDDVGFRIVLRRKTNE